MTPTEAKEFLVSRVIEQARLEKAPLSELEAKMLGFSEAHPSGPDMYDIAAQFEESYDTVEYETKITLLLRNACRLDEKTSADNILKWKNARRALRWEDHYIKVMASPAIRYAHRGRDFLIYVGIGLAAVIIILVLASHGAR
jgi:hypothetical protein